MMARNPQNAQSQIKKAQKAVALLLKWIGQMTEWQTPEPGYHRGWVGCRLEDVEEGTDWFPSPQQRKAVRLIERIRNTIRSPSGSAWVGQSLRKDLEAVRSLFDGASSACDVVEEPSTVDSDPTPVAGFWLEAGLPPALDELAGKLFRGGQRTDGGWELAAAKLMDSESHRHASQILRDYPKWEKWKQKWISRSRQGVYQLALPPGNKEVTKPQESRKKTVKRP